MARVLKIALVVGLLVGVAFELGRPLVARVQLAGAAQDAADQAGRRLDGRTDQRRGAAEEARVLVESRGGTLTRFEVGTSGRVEIEVSRSVDPIVLGGVKQLSSWYEVRADASSATGP